MDNKNTVIAYQMAVAAFLKNGSDSSFTNYLSADVQWHLPQSMAEFGGSLFSGIDGISQMLSVNLPKFYQAQSIKVEFRSMIGEADFVHMHFAMQATTANNKPYHNDYQILFEVKDEKICNAWEYFDAHALIQLL